MLNYKLPFAHSCYIMLLGFIFFYYKLNQIEGYSFFVLKITFYLMLVYNNPLLAICTNTTKRWYVLIMCYLVAPFEKFYLWKRWMIKISLVFVRGWVRWVWLIENPFSML
jgi:hypothetical protein